MVQEQNLSEGVVSQNTPAKTMDQTMPVTTTKQIPGNVKAVGILWYIFAGLIILGIIIAFSAFGIMFQFTSFDFLTGAWFYLILVTLIGLIVLFFFVARGIFKLKKWARIAAIILSSIFILSTIYSFIQEGNFDVNIIPLVIMGYILYVLLINKKAREAFK